MCWLAQFTLAQKCVLRKNHTYLELCPAEKNTGKIPRTTTLRAEFWTKLYLCQCELWTMDITPAGSSGKQGRLSLFWTLYEISCSLVGSHCTHQQPIRAPAHHVTHKRARDGTHQYSLCWLASSVCHQQDGRCKHSRWCHFTMARLWRHHVILTSHNMPTVSVSVSRHFDSCSQWMWTRTCLFSAILGEEPTTVRYIVAATSVLCFTFVM